MKYVLPGVETKRLKFRLLEQNDFSEWTELFASKETARFLTLDEKLSSEELCQIWFDKVNDRYENDLGGMNVLVDKDSNKMVGQCGLLVQQVNDQKYLEIGYSILPKYWGMGYATEAASKCKEEGFQRNYSELLISMVHQENQASAQVAIKNGMELIEKIPDFHGAPFLMYGISKI